MPTDGYVLSWCDASEVTGATSSWEELAAEVSGWNLEFTFNKLARMLACMQNVAEDRTEALIGWSRADLEALRDLGPPAGSSVARTLLYRWDRSRRPRIVGNEKGLLLAQALVLAQARPDGCEPSHEEVTWMLLRVHDHTTGLQSGSPTPEQMLAEVAHSLRFNRRPDFLRELARADLILSCPPSTRPDLQGDEWRSFLRSAFADVDFSVYSDHFLVPLALESGRWMAHPKTPLAPIIQPKIWGSELRLGAAFSEARLAELSISLVEAKRAAQEALTGPVKRVPSFMFRTPLVQIGEQLTAVAPSLVQGQLHTGIWGRCLAAARRAAWARGEQDSWHKVFGVLFDQYAEWVASEAARMPGFQGPIGYHLVPRTGVGSADEIEDVVLAQGENVLLASCKAGLIPEPAIRQSADPAKIMEWLTRVFFREERDEHRRGAAFLLDARIRGLREGRFEPQLGRGMNVYPVFVMYDHLGESDLLLRWFVGEVSRHGLFGGEHVNPPVVIDIAVFEQMMSFVGHGNDVWAALRAVSSDRSAGGSLERYLRDAAAPMPEVLRLPALISRFEALIKRVKANFKPQPAPP
ncbi:MAG: hypothetical protein HYZ28_17835 [Myxococcales bacterium]|nr:hypothetical protein [Myxococcales bacterium]